LPARAAFAVTTSHMREDRGPFKSGATLGLIPHPAAQAGFTAQGGAAGAFQMEWSSWSGEQQTAAEEPSLIAVTSAGASSCSSPKKKHQHPPAMGLVSLKGA